jgi:hypothetical protein
MPQCPLRLRWLAQGPMELSLAPRVAAVAATAEVPQAPEEAATQVLQARVRIARTLAGSMREGRARCPTGRS